MEVCFRCTVPFQSGDENTPSLPDQRIWSISSVSIGHRRLRQINVHAVKELLGKHLVQLLKYIVY
jgi:hypothetical protein